MGVQLVLHAEDDGLLTLLDGWWGESAGDADYAARRPRSGAIVAVAKVIELVRRHGARAHILHLSSHEEADLVCAAQAAGLPVTFELTGHHLSFTEQDTAQRGARYRLAPAIRSRADQDRLWTAVRAGQPATIGSDHSPHTIEEKNSIAMPGMPGVQELAVAVWTGMRRRWPQEDPDVAISRLVRYLSSGPAKLFGLSGKGFPRLGRGRRPDVLLARSPVAVHRRRHPSEVRLVAVRGLDHDRTGHPDHPGLLARVWDAATGEFGEPDGSWLTRAAAAPLRQGHIGDGRRSLTPLVSELCTT